MRKFKFSAILAIMCMLIYAVSASAAGNLTANLTYYSAECKITVEGISGTLPVKPVDMVVLKGEAELESMQGSDKPIDFRTEYTKAEGAYSITAPLSSSLDGGLYTVYISSAEGKVSKTFIFVNENQSKSALGQLNAASSESEAKSIISINAEKFGLTSGQAATDGGMIAKIVYSGKPAGGYKTAAEVQSKAFLAMAINRIKSADSAEKLDSVIKENDAVLGVNYDEYSAFETEVKEKLLVILKNADYINDNFADIFDDSVAVAKIQGASSWSKLKAAVEAGAEKLGVNMGKGSNYDKVKNKDSVFQKMYKKDLSSIDNIKASFNSAVDETLKDQEKSTAGGGVTGGGNGGNGGSVTSSVEIDSALVNNAAQVDTKTEENSVEFTDINGHWAENEIRRMNEKGVVNGFADKTFRPDNNVTRAEFVKIIVLAFDLKANGTAEYNDVPSDAWFAGYVNIASNLNIVSGYGGYFSPDNAISRQDAAVMIYRMLKAAGISADGAKTFADSESIADYAVEAVAALAANSIMVGSEAGFEPEAPTTRAQVVKIVANVLRYMGKE